jgi:pteridine reductase
MNLDGSVALVTGAARRVGRVLALALARAGADVAIHFHNSGAEAEAVAREVERLGRRPLLLRADLTDADAPPRLIARVVEAYGRFDLLVNNAATFVATPIPNITPADWDRVHAVNLRAPFFLAQAAAPHLRRSGGLIVNIADLAAYQAWPGYTHHCTSKAGLVHLTRVLARGLAPEIRVAAIAPGTVLPPDDFSQTDVERERARAPLGRIGTPEDVAQALLFLAGNDFVTGEVIVVDGGRMLR